MSLKLIVGVTFDGDYVILESSESTLMLDKWLDMYQRSKTERGFATIHLMVEGKI